MTTTNIKEMTNEELYKKYGVLVEQTCRAAQRQSYWAIEEDEALQVGWIALLKAKENYTPPKSGVAGNIEAYICFRIRGAIKDEVRKVSGVKKSGDKSTFSIRYFEKSIEEFEPHERENLLPMLDPEISRCSFDHLVEPLKNDQGIQVLKLLYLYDKNIREASEALNVSESRISQVHHEALAKLRYYQRITRYAA